LNDSFAFQVTSFGSTGNFASQSQAQPVPVSLRTNQHYTPTDGRRTVTGLSHTGSYTTGLSNSKYHNPGPETGWSNNRSSTLMNKSSPIGATNQTSWSNSRPSTGSTSINKPFSVNGVQWPGMGDAERGLSSSLGMGDAALEEDDDDDDALLGSIDMPEERMEEREVKRAKTVENRDKENLSWGMLDTAPFVYLAAIQQEIKKNPSRKFVVTIKVRKGLVPLQ